MKQALQILNDKYRILNRIKRIGSTHSVLNIRYSVFPVFGIFGTIDNPLSTTFGATGYGSVQGGLGLLITNIVKLVTISAGLWSFANLLMAGLTYITSSGEAEKITAAWAKIWQSLIGLLIIASAFAITAIISRLVFGTYTAILNPIIYGPGTVGP